MSTTTDAESSCLFARQMPSPADRERAHMHEKLSKKNFHLKSNRPDLDLVISSSNSFHPLEFSEKDSTLLLPVHNSQYSAKYIVRFTSHLFCAYTTCCCIIYVCQLMSFAWVLESQQLTCHAAWRRCVVKTVKLSAVVSNRSIVDFICLYDRMSTIIYYYFSTLFYSRSSLAQHALIVIFAAWRWAGQTTDPIARSVEETKLPVWVDTRRNLATHLS